MKVLSDIPPKPPTQKKKKENGQLEKVQMRGWCTDAQTDEQKKEMRGRAEGQTDAWTPYVSPSAAGSTCPSLAWPRTEWPLLGEPSLDTSLVQGHRTGCSQSHTRSLLFCTWTIHSQSLWQNSLHEINKRSEQQQQQQKCTCSQTQNIIKLHTTNKQMKWIT